MEIGRSVLKQTAMALQSSSGWSVVLGKHSKELHTCGVFYSRNKNRWYYYVNTSWCNLLIRYDDELEAFEKLIRFLEYEAKKRRINKTYDSLEV